MVPKGAMSRDVQIHATVRIIVAGKHAPFQIHPLIVFKVHMGNGQTALGINF